LGSYAYYIIAPAALATMVSTALTCLDAYPRVLEPTAKLLFAKKNKHTESKYLQLFWLLLLVGGTITVFAFFMSSMTEMVDFATVLFFITAPVLGLLNLRAVTGKNMPKGTRPKLWLVLLSIIGLIALTGLSVYYLYILFV
jgi:Mn2+/Fe2+ NRAMP family transporter